MDDAGSGGTRDVKYVEMHAGAAREVEVNSYTGIQTVHMGFLALPARGVPGFLYAPGIFNRFKLPSPIFRYADPDPGPYAEHSS